MTRAVNSCTRSGRRWPRTPTSRAGDPWALLSRPVTEGPQAAPHRPAAGACALKVTFTACIYKTSHKQTLARHRNLDAPSARRVSTNKQRARSFAERPPPVGLQGHILHNPPLRPRLRRHWRRRTHEHLWLRPAAVLARAPALRQHRRPPALTQHPQRHRQRGAMRRVASDQERGSVTSTVLARLRIARASHSCPRARGRQRAAWAGGADARCAGAGGAAVPRAGRLPETALQRCPSGRGHPQRIRTQTPLGSRAP